MTAVKSLTVRENVTVDDTSNPSTGSGVAVGYDRVPVEVTLAGTNPQATITPLLINAAGNGYVECEPVTVSGAKAKLFSLDTLKSQNVNFRIDGISGTGTSVTVKVYLKELK